ncbi:uncharacterized protein VP01_787g1 [Puccinia sorghi]|uniref:Uncharacterized protein n=1 Tax=Puccinia sorghi TaxID=27349 RepID=A0A0L6UAV9_9BASI|nr:uncharacterized protein VP01_787g1 [Puccinia sorghi]
MSPPNLSVPLPFHPESPTPGGFVKPTTPHTPLPLNKIPLCLPPPIPPLCFPNPNQPFDGICGPASDSFVGQIGLQAVTYPKCFHNHSRKVVFAISFMKGYVATWSQLLWCSICVTIPKAHCTGGIYCVVIHPGKGYIITKGGRYYMGKCYYKRSNLLYREDQIITRG